MSIADNIKNIREQRGMRQKEVYTALGIGKSVYSKIENEGREATVQELLKLSELFDLTVDQIIHYNEKNLPAEVTIEDKAVKEQMKLMSQLSDDDKKLVSQMIDKLLTNQKFKTFFQENAQ